MLLDIQRPAKYPFGNLSWWVRMTTEAMNPRFGGSLSRIELRTLFPIRLLIHTNRYRESIRKAVKSSRIQQECDLVQVISREPSFRYYMPSNRITCRVTCIEEYRLLLFVATLPKANQTEPCDVCDVSGKRVGKPVKPKLSSCVESVEGE